MNKIQKSEATERSSSALDLKFDDIDLSDIEVKALATDETVGVPDLGASSSPTFSCTHVTQ